MSKIYCASCNKRTYFRQEKDQPLQCLQCEQHSRTWKAKMDKLRRRFQENDKP